jgi:hypothetical protein
MSCVFVAVVVPQVPPVVVKVKVAVPTYPVGGVQVVVAGVLPVLFANVPPATFEDQIPPVALPLTEPPKVTVVLFLQIAASAVPALAVGPEFTVTVVVLLAMIFELQLPLVKFVIVTAVAPLLASALVVNDPVPAVVTTIVAVLPVAALGFPKLYVTVYVPVGKFAARPARFIVAAVPAQIGDVAVVEVII